MKYTHQRRTEASIVSIIMEFKMNEVQKKSKTSVSYELELRGENNNTVLQTSFPLYYIPYIHTYYSFKLFF